MAELGVKVQFDCVVLAFRPSAHCLLLFLLLSISMATLVHACCICSSSDQFIK